LERNYVWGHGYKKVEYRCTTDKISADELNDTKSIRNRN
jgi:hypothetical protein